MRGLEGDRVLADEVARGGFVSLGGEQGGLGQQAGLQGQQVTTTSMRGRPSTSSGRSWAPQRRP
jgi:hypothetical protein